MPNPQKIAILGGGVGALSAAFAITDDPDWKNKYEITVYQVGWRLGGKGASGRNPVDYARIEEHGLHIWPGFYDNAFDMIKRCYEELDRDPSVPLATWSGAFAPLNHVYLTEKVNGKWLKWRLDFPPNSRTPGKDDPWTLTPSAYAGQLLQSMKDHYLGSPLASMMQPLPVAAYPRSLISTLNIPEWRNLSPLVLSQKIYAAGASIPGGHSSINLDTVAWLMKQFTNQLKIEQAAALQDNRLRRLLIALELGAVLVYGMIADDVITLGFDHLDDQEWSAWMSKHGASDLVLNSALVRTCYDFVFGYLNADPANRAVAAGAGTRLLLRLLFTYKEAFFFKMQAGMGDTIFAPLYLVLKKRGVVFRFFHRVRKIRASTSSTEIDEIDIGRQVDLVGAANDPACEYQPLITVKDLPCWSSTPDPTQIVQAKHIGTFDLESYWTDWQDVENLTLKRNKDFDLVILGISIGVFKDICQDLIARNSRWAAMVNGIKTVQTQSLQLWLNADHYRLGYSDPDTVLTAFEEPFDTWADMTHLVSREDWSPNNTPSTIAYFCGAFDDAGVMPPIPNPTFPLAETTRVGNNATNWQTQDLTILWPNFVDTQIADRYVRANINPSDRYVQSVPGSTKLRLPAGESGFDNLYLAGDWVLNGLNGGCVEAAAMAGMAAARALTGRPIVISGESDTAVAIGSSPYAAENAPFPWSVAYGVGELQAAAVTLALKRSAVAQMLPSGLALAPQSLTASGLHPVGLVFARHRNVRPNLLPMAAISYRELLFAIPFVEPIDAAEPPGPLTFLPRVYVGRLLPQALGTLLYAYAKRLAVLSYKGEEYLLKRFVRDETLVHATLASNGQPRPIENFPNLAIARTMLEQPLVSVDPLGCFHYSYLDLHLDSATFAPLTGSISIDSAILAGLPIGQFTVRGVDTTPLGSFWMDTRWTLTNPLESGRLAQLIRENNAA